MSGLIWTPEQNAIFEWFQNGCGNLVVVARAGTSKTTTCLEGINRARHARNVLLCAYNKPIADELSRRLLNPAASAKTLNAVGWRFVRRMWPNCAIEEREQRGQRARYLSTLAAPDAPDAIVRLISKLHSFAREMMPFAPDGASLLDLAWDQECVPAAEWVEQGWDDRVVCDAAWRAMQAAREYSPLVDFADQIFLPLANNWVIPTYDLTVVDEAQDMGPGHIELALRVTRGRICVVGDDRQAIYQFRGADSAVLGRLTQQLEAQVLRLRQTFRCGRAIVEVARRIVPDIVAAPTTGEGLVRRLAVAKVLEEVQPGDAILSRLNAPLIGLCLHLLRAGVPARVEGKDLATGIRTLIRELATGEARFSVDALLVKLAEWERRETDRALATASATAGESRVEFIAERAEAIRVLAQGATEVFDLQVRLDQVFSGMTEEGGSSVVLSSVHKAKGREWDRVYVLEDTLRDGSIEELNIRYVAVTRAKRELVMAFEPASKPQEHKPRPKVGRPTPSLELVSAPVPLRGDITTLEEALTESPAEFAQAFEEEDGDDPFAGEWGAN